MKFRWKLHTLFVMILIAAIFLARYSYVQNRYAGLREPGAVLAYDWERPAFSKNEYGTFVSGKETWFVRRSLTTAPQQKTWFERLNGWLAGDSVAAVTIDARSLNNSAIESMRGMTELDFVLITGATVIPEPDNNLVKLISALKKELPGVKIHTDPELKHAP